MLALPDVAGGSVLHAQGISLFYRMSRVIAPLGKALGVPLASVDFRQAFFGCCLHDHSSCLLCQPHILAPYLYAEANPQYAIMKVFGRQGL